MFTLLYPQLDNLPSSLKEFACNYSSVKSLDYLPKNLEILECFGCKITMLNNLPNSLIELSCNPDIQNLDEIKKQNPNIKFTRIM